MGIDRPMQLNDIVSMVYHLLADGAEGNIESERIVNEFLGSRVHIDADGIINLETPEGNRFAIEINEK